MGLVRRPGARTQARLFLNCGERLFHSGSARDLKIHCCTATLQVSVKWTALVLRLLVPGCVVPVLGVLNKSPGTLPGFLPGTYKVQVVLNLK